MPLLSDKLSPLQKRVLEILADLNHPNGWTLTGGGALAGFYSSHRETRDLDLFWYGTEQLGSIAAEAVALLRAAHLDPQTIQVSPSFARIQARDSSESVLVDLVATPDRPILRPLEHQLHVKLILVESEYDIAITKLTTLLSRSEIRDLWDLKVLLERGASLRTLLDEAPKKDGGFSALTLAWVLRAFPVARLAASAGLTNDLTIQLATFRDGLVDQLVALASEGDDDEAPCS